MSNVKQKIKLVKTLSFRTAKLNDTHLIAHLVNEAYRPAPGKCGWTHEAALVSGDRTNAAQVVGAISRDDSVILIGQVESEIMACVHIEKDGRNAYIGMLAVRPDRQCTGAGKEILAEAEHYATTHFQPEKFIMNVISSRTELVSFYERRGYRKTGDVTDYPLSAGVGIPKYSGLKVESLEKRSNALLDLATQACPST
jgi:ribosomal protein S18 acetylase RimI-like enzyme